MKFFYILLLLIITCSVKTNKQLFEALEKEDENNVEKDKIDVEGKNSDDNPPSLFIQKSEKSESNEEEVKSLFNNKSKSETSEKSENGENASKKETSLFGTSENKEAANTETNLKEESKVEKSTGETNNKSSSTNETEKNKASSEIKVSAETENKNVKEKNANNNSNQKENRSLKVAKKNHNKKVLKKSMKNKRVTIKRNQRKSEKKHKKASRTSSSKNKKDSRNRRNCRLKDDGNGKKLRVCGRKSATNRLIHGRKKKLSDINIKFLEEKISVIGDQVKSLKEVNSALNKKINDLEKSDKSEDKNDMISFIQKESSSLNTLKKAYEKDTKEIKKQLKLKDSSLHEVLDKNSYSINYLGNQILILEKELADLQIAVHKAQSDLQGKISDRKNHDKVEYKQIKAKSASLGALEINGDVLKINPNSKISFGELSISANDFKENLAFISLVKKNCGNDFTKCKILTNEDYKKERADEEEILKNVRKLRKDSMKVFR